MYQKRGQGASQQDRASAGSGSSRGSRGAENGRVSFAPQPGPQENYAYQPDTRPLSLDDHRLPPDARGQMPLRFNPNSTRSPRQPQNVLQLEPIEYKPPRAAEPSRAVEPVRAVQYAPSGAPRRNDGYDNPSYKPPDSTVIEPYAGTRPTRHSEAILWPSKYSYGNYATTSPTVVEQKRPHRRIPRVKMVIGLGAIQVTIGLIAFLANIISIASESIDLIYSGFWVGFSLVLAGAFGIAAGKSKSFRLCVSTMILSIMTACVCVGGITLMLVVIYLGEMVNDRRVTTYGYIRTLSFIFGMGIVASVAETFFCGPCCYK
ncbi:uncharacterized protein LOC141911303 [Tubulanus polymorphus]|uniref:uncharacterized protein LOC141911303 n=1 Tax=Tubulanus polymorphus TaxID=672921 RepID=UPI003DA464AE